MNDVNISAEEHNQHSVRHPIFIRMMNFFKWWLGFTGLIAGTSVCPFCGQPGCPVGVGVASTMGGFFALFMQNWKEPFKRLYRRFGKKEVGQ
jgi:hypothetical protein